MSQSELELRGQDLERRIAQKEREIGQNIEVIRATAIQASQTVVQTTVGVAVGAAVLLVGAFITWQVVRSVRRSRAGEPAWQFRRSGWY